MAESQDSSSCQDDGKVQDDSKSGCYQEDFFKFMDSELMQHVSDDTIAAIKVYYNKTEESKNNNHDLVTSRLRKELNRQVLKCESLEQSRSFLRCTIKKASASWSERKSQLSESECDHEPDDINAQKELLSCASKRFENELDIFTELKYKNEQLELSERRADDLNKRLKDYEKVIDDQEIIIHGLKEQLDTYFTDNLKMSKQLAELSKLFQEIEATNYQEVNQPTTADGPMDPTDSIPSQEEYNGMSKSVSKTYIKLKELIYEKKSLVTEIERLKTLNVELQLRVSQQENRLVSVSDALQSTWLIVSNLKDEHAKIHTEESILRYELKEKREILHKLREELEWGRDQWHTIRKINSQSEEEWRSLRNDLDNRRNKEDALEKSESSEAKPTLNRESSFEPPIDLLLDMGIEYGVVDADDDEPATGIALIHGEDVHNERLRDLEDQCCFLYQKLMTSTTRALALTSRLTSLHEHYSMSDDEEEEEEDEDLFEDNNNDILYESSIVSQDSEGNDTAYVSEADRPESTEPSTSASNTHEPALKDEEPSYGSSPDDGCDVLSKRLINFLPKKIEILSNENKILEAKLLHLQEEKKKSEAGTKTSLDFEIRQRRKLEEQLAQLGKCVDELKLERNGKIEKAEEELQRKIEEIDNEHKGHLEVIDELECLKEKFDERGELLRLTSLQLQQAESRATTAEEALYKFKKELDSLQAEMIQLKQSQLGIKAAVPPEEVFESRVNRIHDTDYGEKADISFDNNKETTTVDTHGAEGMNSLSSGEDCSTKLQQESAECTPQVIIHKESTFRLSFYLLPNTVLHWIISVPCQEISFGITFVAKNMTEKQADVPSRNEYLSSEENCTSVDLTSPVLIRSVDSPLKGRLTPKISGQYCLSFTNTLPSNQLIKYQIWIQNTEDNR